MFSSVPNTMPNPFTGADFPASYNGGVNDPNSMIDSGNQHGSAEPNMGRSFSNLSSMTPPRTPRDRSPAARGDEEQHREDRRAERRESRRRDTASEPVGVNFRLSSCETTLREHHAELQNQRTLIDQLVQQMIAVNANKVATENRLVELFTHVDTEVTKAMGVVNANANTTSGRLDSLSSEVTKAMGIVDSHWSATNGRIDSLMATMNQLTADLSQRFEQISSELQTARASQQAPSPMFTGAPATAAPETPPGMQGFIPRQCDFGQAPVFGNGTSGQAEPAPAPHSPPTFQGKPDGAQSFGIGTKGTTTTFHNIGSPLSGQASAGLGGATGYDPSYPPPPGAAFNFGRWAPGAGTERQPFDPKFWSTENKKVTKELKAYDGDIAHYDNWRRRVRDHFVSVNHNYSTVFNHREH